MQFPVGAFSSNRPAPISLYENNHTTERIDDHWDDSLPHLWPPWAPATPHLWPQKVVVCKVCGYAGCVDVWEGAPLLCSFEACDPTSICRCLHGHPFTAAVPVRDRPGEKGAVQLRGAHLHWLDVLASAELLTSSDAHLQVCCPVAVDRALRL